MAKLKISSQIVDEVTKVYLTAEGFPSTSFDDVSGFLASMPEGDEEVDMHINCMGGDVVTGWGIYDILRQSGKKISAVIEGQCSSMASVILLAAPKEERRALSNAYMCIHNPEACYLSYDFYERLTADAIDAMTDKLRTQAESLRQEQEKILNLYVERTGSDKETLQALMNEDIYINMTRAKELGFISEVLAPNTAKKLSSNNPITMNKNQVQVEEGWLNRLLRVAGFASRDEAKFSDMKLTAADGREFEVEREEGTPQVGDAAAPDGTYIMEDGSTIVVEDGVIASITDSDEDAKLTDPVTGNELSVAEAQQLLVTQQATIAELEEKLKATESESEAKADELAQTITGLEEQLSAKDKEITDLTLSDEQREILATVEGAGGKAWLDSARKMESNGAPKDMPNDVGKEGNAAPRLGQGFLDSQKKPIRIKTNL